MRIRTSLLLLCVLSAAGCTQFPELDQRITPELANAPAPDLVPLAPLIARAESSSGAAASALADVEPRLAALRARAARLRGPVIPAADRNRMLRRVR